MHRRRNVSPWGGRRLQPFHFLDTDIAQHATRCNTDSVMRAFLQKTSFIEKIHGKKLLPPRLLFLAQIGLCIKLFVNVELTVLPPNKLLAGSEGNRAPAKRGEG